jgi:AcrR family transcriptional regulator
MGSEACIDLHGQYSPIMGMSIPYELTGRRKQKARTRDALIAAALELLSQGATPTVEQAADRAGISRTTAYRYFPNRRALLVASYPQIEARSLLDDDAPDDAVARLDVVVDRLTRQVVEHEPELRAALRLSLELPRPDAEALALRQGRAIGWIEDALAPLRDRLGAEETHRLALAIRAAVGIEPLVWLTDVGGLSRDEAAELMRSTARTLLRATMEDADRRHVR